MIVVGMSPPPPQDRGGAVGNRDDASTGPIFAMSAHEVTIEQHRRLRPEGGYAGDVSPDRHCPMNKVTWCQAAQYCRWLSEQEELDEEEMCFPAVDEIGPEMTLPDDCLNRTGYRLPTEAEWEFACCAGTATSRFFGETEEMLPQYAWYDVSSEGHLWPVGSLKPNPWGFFDVYGNVLEWCHEPFVESGAAEAGRGKSVVRGGAYRRSAELATSHRRESHPSDSGVSFVGFRIARTIRE